MRIPTDVRQVRKPVHKLEIPAFIRALNISEAAKPELAQLACSSAAELLGMLQAKPATVAAIIAPVPLDSLAVMLRKLIGPEEPRSVTLEKLEGDLRIGAQLQRVAPNRHEWVSQWAYYEAEREGGKEHQDHYWFRGCDAYDKEFADQSA